MNEIKHVLQINGKRLIIGITQIDEKMPVMSRTRFIDEMIHTDEYGTTNVYKIATFDTPNDMTCHMYRYVDMKTCLFNYIIVNNAPYYDENGYKSEIVYNCDTDVLTAENDFDAFVEMIDEYRDLMN